MFKYLVSGYLAATAAMRLDHCRRLSVQLLELEAAKCYVHGVKVARQSAAGLMQLGLVIALISVGLVLLHAGLFVLLPWTVKSKAILGMSLGLAYVVIGGGALRVALDERLWMRKSGASERVDEATRQPGKT